MRSAAVRPLVSEREFLRMPETMNKVELLDGEVIVSPSPNFGHQEILARLIEALRKWARRYPHPATVAQSPLDVRFGKGRILQPDAFVLLRKIPLEHKGPIAHIPELCIEVLSENRIYDRVTKRLVYAIAGVRELWVVDRAGLVERWTGRGLNDSTESRVRLTSQVLPGFSLDLRKLFSARSR
ncbi:MAG TPA: Uma2 family endonuclease [Polyangiaceae bacterium]|jgi:Uma2 family endonuclease